MKLLREQANRKSEGDSISALVLGPRGVGKSFMIKACESQLRREGHKVVAVTVHGNICADDKACMREIYSKFQGALIAMGGAQSEVPVSSFRNGTLSEWCFRLSQFLQECARANHLVLITLESFDSFCHSKAKQSLLYNLFDLMHLQNVRFACVGITTRIDTESLLEKRIKSRFQLRKILLTNPATLDELVEIVERCLAPRCPGKALHRVLHSAELRQNWSLYFGAQFSFVNAATHALVTTQGSTPAERDAALVRAMHRYAAHSGAGEDGLLNCVVRGLNLADHVVLVALLKLHQKRRKPKSFATILREIGAFEKRSSVSQTCRHSRAAYWRSFLKLVRLGLVELASGPPSNDLIDACSSTTTPTHCGVTLPVSELYADLFDAQSNRRGDGRELVDFVPNEVFQWAMRHRDMEIA